MANFQLIEEDIEEGLYVPKRAEKSIVHKFGKVALTIYFSSIILTPSMALNDVKDFTIKIGLQPKLEYAPPPIWENQLKLFKKNKERLNTIVSNLKDSVEWKKYDMQEPTEIIIQNVIDFIASCPNDDLLQSVCIFPRVNGTVLLKWNDTHRLATVNIGTKEYSYAIISKERHSMINGDFKLSEKKTIKQFYYQL